MNSYANEPFELTDRAEIEPDVVAGRIAAIAAERRAESGIQ